jgi:hypothetical protein
MTNIEQFKKWAEPRGINVTETDIPGYVFASTHTENMYQAYLQGLKQAAENGAKARVAVKGSKVVE